MRGGTRFGAGRRFLSRDVGAVDQFRHGIADGVGAALVAVYVSQRVLVYGAGRDVDGERFAR